MSDWFVTRDGVKKAGPFSGSQLQRLVATGQLLPTDRLWKKGLPKWVLANEINGLFPNAVRQPHPPASRPEEAATWYYTRNKQRLGPVSADALKQLVVKGGLQPADLVWKKGMKEWTAAQEVAWLRDAFPDTGPPPLPNQARVTCPFCEYEGDYSEADVANFSTLTCPRCTKRFRKVSCPECDGWVDGEEELFSEIDNAVSCPHCEIAFCLIPCPKCAFGVTQKATALEPVNELVCPECDDRYLFVRCPSCERMDIYPPPRSEHTLGGFRLVWACPHCRSKFSLGEATQGKKYGFLGKFMEVLDASTLTGAYATGCCRHCNLKLPSHATVCPYCTRSQF